jgi:hypothetical protein
MVSGLEGYRGAVQMIDRQGRRLRNALFFESEDNVRTAEPTFESMPEPLRELIRQAQRTVDVLESLFP